MNMKRLMIGLVMIGLLSPALIGCNKKASVKQETKTTTPGGTTTVTTEKSVEKTGENPPPATP
jgi:hypothetical protein